MVYRNGSPTTAVDDDAHLEIARSTSASTTSTDTESSFGVGSGSTSGSADEIDAVLVMPSPSAVGVTVMVTVADHHQYRSPTSQVTVWPSTSHGAPVTGLYVESIWRPSGTTSVITTSRARAGPLL